MKLKEQLHRHWRRYGITERAFVLLPFLILTPRLLNHLNGDHNGEPSQEFVITLTVFGLLILFSLEARRTTILRFDWQQKSIWLWLAMVSFTLWSGVSLFWTKDVGATQDHTILWLNYTTVIFIGYNVLRRRSVIGLIATLITLGLAIALFRLLHYWVSSTGRSLASPIYRNLGVEPELLVTILPLIIAVYLTARRRGLVTSALVVAALVWMGSLSTYQRAPILASLLAAGLLAVGIWRKWLVPHSNGRMVVLALTLLVTGGFQLSLPSKVQDQQGKKTGKDFVVKQIKGIKEMEVDTSSRLQFWGAAIEMARVSPVLGVGAGAYKTTYVTYRGIANTHPYWGRVKDFSQLDGTDFVYRAHNEFMQILGELGLVGLAIITAVGFALAGLLWNMPRPQQWLAVGVGAGALAFFISSSLTSYSFRWIPCGFLFFLLCTLVLPRQRSAQARGASASTPTFRSTRWIIATAALFVLFGVGRTGQVILSEYYQLQAQEQAVFDKEQGIELYKRALAIDPYNFSASAELGSLFYRNNNPQAAIPYLAAGVQHGINNVSTHAILSFAYAQLGQQTRAREVLQQAVAAYPGTIFARLLYAEALAKEGRLQTANEQRAIAQAINAGDAEAWELILQRGVRAATIAAHQQRLSHPIKLEPRNGLTVIQERERLAQGQ